MTKPITLIFTLFFSCLSFAEPQVWQASKEGVTFTIMGSVHAGRPDFYPLPDIAQQRFNQADALVVEADIVNDTQVSFPPGKPARHYLNSSQQQKLTAVANDVGLPADNLLNLPPWQVAMALQLEQISTLELQQSLGIDLHFLSQAIAMNKPVIALETVQQQVDLLTQADNDGLELLTDTLDYWTLSKDFMPCLIASWQTGDTEKLTAIVDDMGNASDFEHTLIDERNHNWLKAMTDRSEFAKGNYMMVVGALHLYGKQGLLQLLTNAGFDLTPLTPGKESSCTLPAMP